MPVRFSFLIVGDDTPNVNTGRIYEITNADNMRSFIAALAQGGRRSSPCQDRFN